MSNNNYYMMDRDGQNMRFPNYGGAAGCIK